MSPYRHSEQTERAPYRLRRLRKLFARMRYRWKAVDKSVLGGLAVVVVAVGLVWLAFAGVGDCCSQKRQQWQAIRRDRVPEFAQKLGAVREIACMEAASCSWTVECTVFLERGGAYSIECRQDGCKLAPVRAQ